MLQVGNVLDLERNVKQLENNVLQAGNVLDLECNVKQVGNSLQGNFQGNLIHATPTAPRVRRFRCNNR